MKLKSSTGKKFRYGGTSLLMIAAILAVIISFNFILTLLVQRYGLYVDLTPDLHFTISEECFDLIGKKDDKDGVDTPIEMLDKRRAENDKLTAEAKAENKKIAEYNKSVKANNDAINAYLEKQIDKLNENRPDNKKETYVPYESYIPYTAYPEYTESNQSKIADIAQKNEAAKRENNRIKAQNEEWLDQYKGKLPKGKEIKEYKEYVEYSEDPVIKIIFLTPLDYLETDETAKYVVFNTRDELKVKFPDYIAIEYINPKTNPSKLDKYRNSSNDENTIKSDDVIIECGTEYRILTLASFYMFGEDPENPIGYNAEKKLASSILAITRASVPLACLTVNHGETIPDAANGNPLNSPFATALMDAGYNVETLDLARQEIPEECRILVVFNPQNDFISDKDGINKVSELDKLDAFLEDRNALMVFMSPDSYTGRLNNLEDFLAEWGLAINRNGNDPIMVRDESSSIMGSSSAVIGDYSENILARGWFSGMLQTKPYVVFPNASAITYPTKAGFDRDWVTDPEKEELQYFITQGNGRTVYDLFYGSTTAKGYVNDGEILGSNERERISLAAVSVQTYIEQEATQSLQDSAFVVLCGSTDFASKKYLESNTYGNDDFLHSTLKMSGRDPVPVGLSYKAFSNYEISTVTSNAATAYTVVLTLAPIVIFTGLGIFILVRRKNA